MVWSDVLKKNSCKIQFSIGSGPRSWTRNPIGSGRVQKTGPDVYHSYLIVPRGSIQRITVSLKGIFFCRKRLASMSSQNTTACTTSARKSSRAGQTRIGLVPHLWSTWSVSHCSRLFHLVSINISQTLRQGHGLPHQLSTRPIRRGDRLLH